jgi:hypothetical protein
MEVCNSRTERKTKRYIQDTGIFSFNSRQQETTLMRLSGHVRSERNSYVVSRSETTCGARTSPGRPRVDDNRQTFRMKNEHCSLTAFLSMYQLTRARNYELSFAYPPICTPHSRFYFPSSIVTPALGARVWEPQLWPMTPDTALKSFRDYATYLTAISDDGMSEFIPYHHPLPYLDKPMANLPHRFCQARHTHPEKCVCHAWTWKFPL